MKCPTVLFLISCTVLRSAPCKIEIVDKQDGWPVPMVELRSTHDTRHVSDNFGLIAIDDPELLGREIWFHVKGHGYGVPKDGFGYEGIRTTLKAGGTLRIEVERRIIARRIGRLTGAGRFAEGEKLGIASPAEESVVFGCDSVLTAKHDGKLFWLWGDTTMPSYPLGIFHSSAATTKLEPLNSYKPPLALSYAYFRDDTGKPRGVANMEGDGPTWLSGLVSWPDKRLGATYSKIKGFLDEYEVGLCSWDCNQSKFVAEKTLWRKEDGGKPLLLKGHPVRWKDESGKSWLLFGDPFPDARCPDGYESWKNSASWEKLDPPQPPQTKEGKGIAPHRGSIAWNAHRKCWITIFTENRGKPSAFGEIWYAEAASPLGPWSGAVKVLSHDNYTFYNPRIQTDLTPGDATFILFEGTYTAEFADHAVPTPRYNYNQILYRLDLDDPALRH